ncbi:DUF305 domain-containing protein [Streptomyces atratus]|uniref:DUF305 domain-containing protein n=1 Tax=Streptomyces atratus TaxID=1893 RepID=UPI00225ABA33|nr:DUF305 domain-containing protein [Streptomyces atratus]MCX5338920.1 DUF305 domain-containing protein [Streptomyces atratus]
MSASLSSPARRRALAAAGIVASLALALAACGSSEGSKTDGSSMPGMDHGSSAPATPGSAFNDADVKFAQQMIPHHQQAIEMAKLAGGRAADPEIKELAAAIEKAQDPEINTMKGWLTSWGKPLPSASASMGDMPGMDHGSDGSGMPGMMSDKDMSDLEAAKGKDFDKKFAQLMIGHHEGAVTMAEDEQKNGSNADAKKLAGAVITAQTAEIEKMNKIISRL